MPCFVGGGVVSLGMFARGFCVCCVCDGGIMEGRGYLTAPALLLCFDAPG